MASRKRRSTSRGPIYRRNRISRASRTRSTCLASPSATRASYGQPCRRAWTRCLAAAPPSSTSSSISNEISFRGIHMAGPSLQDGIDKAGSPVKLLWKPNAPPFKVPVIKPEFTSWQEEQSAAEHSPCFSDLSHHMSDTFFDGPDCTRLLKAVSANDYDRFEVGQAKQFVPVTAEGYIITDGILMRDAEDRYTLSGVPCSQSWVRYHAEKGGYNVTCKVDPDSNFRKDGDPVLFRYQVQGPRALELVERVFGGSLPKTKFFHSTPVSLGGRKFRALRHGMLGLAGYEFIGAYADGAFVKDALLSAGKD